MYKLLLYTLLASFVLLLHVAQTDEELAMHALFQAKHAANRAAHAAAQQLDEAKLGRGVFAIDPVRAEETALAYLQANLQLDERLEPLPGSYWRSRIELVEFFVVSEQEAFPYTYRHPLYDYEVTLNHPGVVLIFRIEYPRVFRLLDGIVWHIKSVHELVYA